LYWQARRFLDSLDWEVKDIILGLINSICISMICLFLIGKLGLDARIGFLDAALACGIERDGTKSLFAPAVIRQTRLAALRGFMIGFVQLNVAG
jgi:hypothetical protein